MSFNIKIPFVTATHAPKRSGTTWLTSKSKAGPLGFDTSNSNKFTWKEGSTVRVGVSEDATQTLANKTLTSPTITGATISTPTLSATAAALTSPVITGAAGTGFPIVKKGTLTENGAATSYTLTVPVPAGATILDIRVIARVLWNGTSASLTVGDTASANGFFTALSLKATDLVVGEMLSVTDESLWGGKEGAYLVAATGRRGPTASNFGLYYAAGSNINFVVTPGAADGSAGRTECVVVYAVGETIAQVTV